jgi:hypothetical protein
LGSWIKVAIESYDGIKLEQIENKSLGYFKYSFYSNGNLYISTHYSYNGDSQKYIIRNNIIELNIFNKKFLIEKVNNDSLILVELDNGNLTEKCNRHKFIKEQKYLDMLPVNPNDKIEIENDTVYFESEKLYPRLKNDLSSSYHVYFGNVLDINSIKGEYAFATFVIYPNGDIKSINVFHHVDKTFDKKLVEAIQKTKNMWQLPECNGRKVPIIKTVEFWNIIYDNNKIGKFSMEYNEYFKLSVYMFLNKNYNESLEYIDKCENLVTNDANLILLRYLCYKGMGNNQLSDKNLELLNKTKLKYLLK